MALSGSVAQVQLHISSMLYVVIWMWSQAEGVNLSKEPPSGLAVQAPQAYPAGNESGQKSAGGVDGRFRVAAFQTTLYRLLTPAMSAAPKVDRA